MEETNPTYRDQVVAFEENWWTVRRMLRRRDQANPDRFTEHARDHADPGHARYSTGPERALPLSTRLARQRELADPSERGEDR